MINPNDVTRLIYELDGDKNYIELLIITHNLKQDECNKLRKIQSNIDNARYKLDTLRKILYTVQ